VNETGQEVTLIAHREASAKILDIEHRHPSSLPGVVIPRSIRIEHAGRHSLADSDVVVVAVPAQQLRSTLGAVKTALHGKSVLSAVKGLELGTLLRPSEVIATVLGIDTRIGVISGPNLSSEIAAGLPATTVIATAELTDGESLRALLHSSRFRVYLSDDVIGVELGGALKNIVAIGAGIADGMSAGDNAKAAFLTRGIAEIARLGVACGARPLTFAGLSGIGDLIATCSSSFSRNHQVGVALAHGTPLLAILDSMPEVAEGVPTTRAARELGKNLEVDIPIIDQMYRVLFEGVSPAEAIERLMEREPKVEQSHP
jgi:glycerol-3-phosphate dehydrogenase (NAD(P)+)